MTRQIRLPILVAVLALVVAACGGDSAEDTTTTEAEATTTTEAEATTTIEADATSTTEAMMEETVLDIAAANEDFSTLAAAVEAAGLQDALSDPEATLTVFAPTNEAFEAALASLGLTAEELLADTETLTAILTYHVLGDVVTSSDIVAAGTEEIPVEMLSGEELVVAVGDDGTVGFVDQTATVTMADIEASNGVIHVIDAVLLPPSMSS
jgi:transforming growth factor-beta-induced protein